MTQKSPLIFFGSDKFVLPILKTLQQHYDIPLVLTTEHNGIGAISTYCKENNIHYLPIQKFTEEVLHQLQTVHAQVAVLAYFGLILPQSVLELFPKGIINIHPSLLPKFRGPTPVQSALLAGEETTGVSIIRLDHLVDHGPLLAQKPEQIVDSDTSETLHEKLFTRGAQLLLDVLPPYLSGKLIPTSQDDTKATFTKKLTRNSGFIDVSSLENKNVQKEVARKIRAYYPWPGVWTKTTIKDKEVRIKLLPADTLQVEGKNPMSYKDFVNGYPEKREWLSKLLL
jgi:methionyl-tRNA formyltransferase